MKHLFVPILLMLWCSVCSTVFAQRAPDALYTFADFVEPDFPFITTTLDADTLGSMYPQRNIAVRCLAIQLGNESYACFDTDLLRMAVAWRGDFISLLSMPQVSYHKAGNKNNGIPAVLGNPVVANGVYPGWYGRNLSFTDPRPEGPNPAEAGRGPLPADWGQWKGVSVVEEGAVLHYNVLGSDIADYFTSLEDAGQVGIVRVVKLDKRTRPLTLAIGAFENGRRLDVTRDRIVIHHPDGDTLTAIGVSGDTEHARLMLNEGRYAVARISPGASTVTRFVMWKGLKADYEAFERMIQTTVEMPAYGTGGPAKWADPVMTQGKKGRAQGAFAVDDLTLPLPNPWERNVRVGDIDFFSNGDAAVATFEGDVWLVRGIDDDLENLQWKRYASGLSEPMSLSIVRDTVYTFGREGIVRFIDLNGDDEADYYENFSNVAVQTIESREFPLSMHALPAGGFVIAKAAATWAGPKTNPTIMTGFRAGGPHSGSILKVSADGQEAHVLASGLRTPYASFIEEKDWILASDQQGNFVPSTPILLVRDGDYYGVPATAHRAMPSPIANPLTWVPHSVDRSSTEQVFVSSGNMGPLNSTIVHLSYGKPGIYRVYAEDEMQGGIATIPLEFDVPLMKAKVRPQDGFLYTAGFQVWDSDAASISGVARVRYTGGSLPIPSRFIAGDEGVLLRFDQKLNPKSALRVDAFSLERWNYSRTEAYGSGHFKPSGEPGHAPVRVERVLLSDDRQSIFLRIADMQEVMQMSVAYDLMTAGGQRLNDAVYFSINHLPVLDLDQEGFSDIDRSADASPLQATRQKLSAQVKPSIEKGEEIYKSIGCMACHSIDGSTEGRSGPSFKGLYGSQRHFVDGSSEVADEAYIRRSILEPSAQVVDGKEVEMPSYVGILDEADVSALILYIKSLGTE